jgi:hypothetical protein
MQGCKGHKPRPPPRRFCRQRSGSQGTRPPRIAGSTSCPSPAHHMHTPVTRCRAAPIQHGCTCVFSSATQGCSMVTAPRMHAAPCCSWACLPHRDVHGCRRSLLSAWTTDMHATQASRAASAEGAHAEHLQAEYSLRSRKGTRLGEDVEADLAADGVHELQVRKLLAQDAHKLLPAGQASKSSQPQHCRVTSTFSKPWPCTHPFAPLRPLEGAGHSCRWR